MAEYREFWHRTRDGIDLYYREYGGKPRKKVPVLCLTGLTRNSKDFHRLAVRLAADRRVLCLDYRGCGRSGYDLDYMHYLVDVDTQDVIGFLDKLKIRRTAMIGTSRGGLVIMTLALTRTDLIAAAVLNDVGPEVKEGGRGKVGRYFGLDYSYPNWKAATAAYADYSRKVAPDLTDEEWQERAGMTFVETGDGRVHFDFDPAMAKAYRERKNAPHSWDKFSALRDKPVLSIRGGTSGILAPDTVEKMRATKPDLMTVTVPNRGHTPFLDEPTAVVAIEAFLAGLP
ncbi:MAG: alpha/beta hydrolase [Alphaproteobacteria bacterium]|nr:alpha/beta hydrolase [Alphaproteobacteria bacterium]